MGVAERGRLVLSGFLGLLGTGRLLGRGMEVMFLGFVADGGYVVKWVEGMGWAWVWVGLRWGRGV